jgi:predicted acetyltransferase
MSHAMPLDHRPATPDDYPLLADWNHQLIREEGHRNTMNVAQLETRLRGWLTDEYQAVIFSRDAEPVAYALYREDPALVYLRQFFVRRDHRRGGVGLAAIRILVSLVWPKDKRLTVEVLTRNHAGVAFWRAAGFQDYSLTLEILPSGSH